MYVRRPRSTYRKKTTVRRKTRSGYKKKSPSTYQSRFNYSKRRYYNNRSIARTLSKFSETKYIACNKIDEQAPVAIQVGALAHMSKFVLGGIPSAWTDCTDLGGITVNQGAADRIGNYTYLKKTTVNLEIDMKEPASGSTLPCEFRVIVFKVRRQAMPAGTTRSPQNSLFLDLVANDFGDATAGINGSDIMLQMTNKRHYTILTDRKFMLSNPLNPTLTAAYSGYYPCMKRMRLTLPHYIKAHYEDANSPTNYDYHYGLFIYARSLDKDTKADNFETNIRAVTTYVDN